MPTSLCSRNPSCLSATTFLLAKTLPGLLFLGVDLKDLKPRVVDVSCESSKLPPLSPPSGRRDLGLSEGFPDNEYPTFQLLQADPKFKDTWHHPTQKFLLLLRGT